MGHISIQCKQVQAEHTDGATPVGMTRTKHVNGWLDAQRQVQQVGLHCALDSYTCLPLAWSDRVRPGQVPPSSLSYHTSTRFRRAYSSCMWYCSWGTWLIAGQGPRLPTQPLTRIILSK